MVRFIKQKLFFYSKIQQYFVLVLHVAVLRGLQ